MLFIVMLTGKCNLNCRYCGGSFDNSVMPEKIEYSISELKDFLSQFESYSIAFYGGEPLLEMETMKKMMDELSAEHYIIQTNGLLLDRLEKEYIQKFSSILISVDGVKEVTELYRGRIYDRVISNAKYVREIFEGELIARMAASQKTDIYRDVLHLLNLGIFTHVHWQIDAVWSADGIWHDFEGWLESYKKGISRLASFFSNELENGRVPGIVPFLGVLKAMIFGKQPRPPCGSGSESFAITTDGRIIACPIAPEIDWNQAGSLREGIKKEISPNEPCPSCKYYGICGGRCLFTNREWLWGERGFNLLCDATIHLINEMERVKDKVIELSYEGVLSLDDFYYPKFNNTTEIIP